MQDAQAGVAERLVEALFRPVDLASRVVFRMAFAAIMLWEFWRFQHYGWIERYWIEPAFSFKYFGFEWVEAWPGHGMFVHFAALAVLAAMILVGLLYRLATPLFFLGFTYVFLLEQARYLNHFYLVCLLGFLLIFVPAHRLFSVDAWLRPSIRSATAPAWSLWLLRFQIGVVYCYGGIAKLNHDWLRGEPIGHWIEKLGAVPLIGPVFVQRWSGLLFAYGGLLIDLLVVPLLLWRRTRWLGFGLVLFFNLTNAYLFDIGIFPWMMIAVSTIFFEPDWPRRLIAWMQPGRRSSPARAEDGDGNEAASEGSDVNAGAMPTDAATVVASPSGPRAGRRVVLTPGRRGVLAALAVWAAIQLLVPLRHWLYPGVVHWTEEGHRFAWHMKLREKTSQCWFVAHDRAADETWEIYAEDTLAGWQQGKMCSRPDMILQFAHHLAEELRVEGIAAPEVQARVFASLHGRPLRLLIDPAVNLALEPRTLGAASWIRPLDPAAPLGDF